ncbi:MAG: hypothetical protein QM784_17115 [Polyangiaceae bacterium]
MRIAKQASTVTFLISTLFMSTAYAADDGGLANEEPGKTEGVDVKVEGSDGNTKAVKELDPGEIERAKQAELANSPLEQPHKTYYFVGMRYRGALIPKFMMNLFGDGGTSVYSDGLGPEFTIRRDNFEYVLSAWWADYGMEPTPFKAKSDPENAWEIVQSKINALYLTSDFNWTSQINPVFGLNLGVGAGFGFVWGDLIRTQAYRDPSGGLSPCLAQGNPDGNYCGTDNNHYNNYKEPSWSGGGSKPIVFPWFALQTGLRIKPHRNFMARIDAGWAITGPFFGIAGNYGL